MPEFENRSFPLRFLQFSQIDRRRKTKIMTKIKLSIGSIAGLLIVLAIGYYFYNRMTYAPDIALHEIKAVDLNNNPVDLSNSKNKTPLVVNFWSTKCEPCVEDFADFEKASGKYRNQVNFAMISDEESAPILEFKSTRLYPFYFLRSTRSFEDYSLGSTPATYFYDTNGKLVSKILGAMQEQQIEKEIRKIIQ